MDYDGQKDQGQEAPRSGNTLGLCINAIVHPLTSRIATAASCCLRPCSGCILSRRRCSLTPAIRAPIPRPRLKQICLTLRTPDHQALGSGQRIRGVPSAGSLRGRGGLAWANRCRRLTDGRTSIASARVLALASIRISLRKTLVILTDVSATDSEIAPAPPIRITP